jgi:hypothetical protein
VVVGAVEGLLRRMMEETMTKEMTEMKEMILCYIRLELKYNRLFFLF